MEHTEVEKLILERFFQKCRLAGGPRVGYMLRRRAICWVEDEHPNLDFGAGLDGLVEKGVLKRNDGGDRYFLSEEGVETLNEL